MHLYWITHILCSPLLVYSTIPIGNILMCFCLGSSLFSDSFCLAWTPVFSGFACVCSFLISDGVVVCIISVFHQHLWPPGLSGLAIHVFMVSPLGNLFWLELWSCNIRFTQLKRTRRRVLDCSPLCSPHHYLTLRGQQRDHTLNLTSSGEACVTT